MASRVEPDVPTRDPVLPTRYWVLAVLTLVYAVNVADRFVLSTLIEPIKAEFRLSDGAVGFLTGTAFALCYGLAGLPLGMLADRSPRRGLLVWSLALWSLFTALCGVAMNFWQLLAARIGVGIGEAGGTPASHSLLADYFHPGERVVAMSTYAVGIAMGAGMGGIFGGLFAERFGWRGCLLLFAGLSAAMLVPLATISDPRRDADARSPGGEEVPTVRQALRFVRDRRALLHILAGGTVADFAGSGLVWWTPAFLTRSHGFAVSEAGILTGLMSGLGGAAALGATTLVALRLARADAAWQCRFLSGLTAVISIAALVAYGTASTAWTLVSLWLFVPFVNAHVGPMFALMQNLVPDRMRATTVAMLLFATNIASLAAAPQLIGWASDLLADHIADPRQSLRIALTVSALSGFWAAWHFHAAIRTLNGDLGHAASA